jgi:hypothetical protein
LPLSVLCGAAVVADPGVLVLCGVGEAGGVLTTAGELAGLASSVFPPDAGSHAATARVAVTAATTSAKEFRPVRRTPEPRSDAFMMPPYRKRMGETERRPSGAPELRMASTRLFHAACYRLSTILFDRDTALTSDYREGLPGVSHSMDDTPRLPR